MIVGGMQMEGFESILEQNFSISPKDSSTEINVSQTLILSENEDLLIIETKVQSYALKKEQILKFEINNNGTMKWDGFDLYEIVAAGCILIHSSIETYKNIKKVIKDNDLEPNDIPKRIFEEIKQNKGDIAKELINIVEDCLKTNFLRKK